MINHHSGEYWRDQKSTVSSEHGVFQYIRQGLRRALFPENVDAQLARDLLSSSGGAALIPIDADNWMFGSPRLRQQRVTASQGCEVLRRTFASYVKHGFRAVLCSRCGR